MVNYGITKNLFHLQVMNYKNIVITKYEKL